MEIVIAIAILLVVMYAIVKLSQFLWKEGIIQKALGSAAVALISGSILFAVTGDPSWGVGGGVVFSIIAFSMGGDA